MDGNNWWPQGGETTMETGDWRATLQPDSRQRIVNKIMETLKKHLPVSGNEGLNELKKIAQRFEEKIYTAATSQSDYLRKISLKMLTMESKSNTAANSAANSSQQPDPGLGVPSQVHNQGQSIPIPLASQSQSRQQLLAQNMQNNISSAAVQSSTGLQSALPPVSGLTQTPMTNVGQNSSMSMSGASQHSVGNSMGQGVPSNMFANAQRQMQGRQQVIPQQQQAQNTQQYMFQQQQLQHQLMQQKIHHGNMQHQLMQSHIQQQQQQQQQQSLLQPNQLQSSQQSVMQTSSVMQPSIMQSSSLSNLQPHQQSNNIQQPTQGMLQQHSQAVMRQQQQQQTTAVHQQQIPMSQQPILPQQQLMNQQSSSANIQQNQLLGQQNSVSDIQHQQQRLLGHQNNVSNIQQQHQQLVNQQSSIPNIHQQQLGGNMSSLQQQQQQLLLSQSGNSSMQTNQQAVHMLQQSKLPLQQQSQPNGSNLLPPQGQQSQTQQSQQQLLPQIQSQPSQLQQHLGMQQQQSNPVQRDMQQRLQQSSPLLQQQNALDQKQLYQSQRALTETSSTSLDSTAQTGQSNGLDWQEEVMQKIKTMRELYMPDLNDLYQKIASKIQQCDALPQAAKTDNVEKIRQFKQMLERTMAFLSVNKNAIMPALKDKLPGYEKQILHLLSTHRPKKPMQQGQLPPPHMQGMQQSQSQGAQGQSHDNQMNSQLQTSNLQSSVATVQQNSLKSLQQNSMPSVSGISTAPQNMMTSLQPANLDSGQANAMSSVQQVAAGALQQNTVSAPQQTNISAMTNQVGVNMLQSNLNNIQPNSNLVQQQHLKQQHDQILQNQQLKQQIQQRHFQQQLMQRQQMLQQQQQQQQQQQLSQHLKQQLPMQIQTHQQPQIHQINDINELKRQGVGVKSGVFQQRSAYPHQQLKPGAQFLASSPQLLQAPSPQTMQHSSPHDQQNLPPTVSKNGTPLQSANSPFVGPTPSPPLAPSPAPAVLSEPEKPVSSVSSLANAGTVGQQIGSTAIPAQSLAIVTPGLSASPLLAECTVNDGAYGNALAAASGKSTVTEQPIERLIKAVKSLSPAALGDSVSDMSSVITMMDRIAGAAPGNGSRAAVGEDLVAMTKCRLQARNFITQDGSTGTKKMRRYTSAMPLNVVSSGGSITDSLKQVTGSEISELESTATSCVKRPRTEANHALLEEIREINRRLIDTKVDVSDEDVDPTGATEVMEGTVVKCSYTAVALCPSLKLRYTSAQMLPIQALRLLVPTDYPNCSPILLDKFPVELRETDDLSEKAKSKFSISLRSLSQPMSLKDIAGTWDFCAREVILEYAQRNGGGSFSSKYGTWEKCLSAAS